METITFDSHGDRCEAWYLAATSDELTTDRGRPCVVMGHGFGATRDAGLLPFAERFAAAGSDLLVFDYRGFGTSQGSPRQDVDHLTSLKLTTSRPRRPSMRVARRLGDRAEVLSFECNHFDIYTGQVFETSVTAQVEFLRRVLS